VVSRRLILPTSATGAAANTVTTFSFPSVSPGYAWEGTINIPNAPPSSTFTAKANSQIVGSGIGASTWGPIVIVGSEIFSINATGLLTGIVYQAIFVGIEVPLAQANFRAYPQSLNTTGPSGSTTVLSETVTIATRITTNVNIPAGTISLTTVIAKATGTATSFQVDSVTGNQSGTTYTTAANSSTGAPVVWNVNGTLDTSVAIVWHNVNGSATDTFTLTAVANFS
jgi:hypothetical protein